MPKVSVEQKGGAPDASDYIAFKRKQAIYNAARASQTGKGVSKALARENLLQKGFTSGIVETRLTNPTSLDTLRFKR